MTILKKLLIFNNPIEELDCPQCRGSGKIKTSPMSNSSTLFIVGLCIGLFVFLMNIGAKQRITDVIGFGFFFILTIITLMEIKEQNARI